MPCTSSIRLSLAFVLAGAFATALAEDGPDGRLYAPCATCHGSSAEGNPELHAPRLAGRPEWYLVKQLRNFRAGLRGADESDLYGAQMARMAEQLWNDAEVAAVAAYVASLPAAPPSSTLRGRANRGAATFVLCAACHGARGEGNADVGAPPLADLDDWYLVAQLDAFRRGTRGNDERDTAGQQMRAALAALRDDEALADVAAYIATLAKVPASRRR